MSSFDFTHLKGKVCAITGGAGVIGHSICDALAAAGIKTAIIDINLEASENTAKLLVEKYKTLCIGVQANVLDKSSLIEARKLIHEKIGMLDFLINGAGGNSPKATTQIEQITENEPLEKSFFGLELEGFDKVFALNFTGTILPTMVFAEDMIKKGKGVILNISSMNSFQPLTKIPAYSSYC